MIMKDLTESLCTGQKIDEEYGKQCCKNGSSQIEERGNIIIINMRGLYAV